MVEPLERMTAANSGLAKVAVSFSASTFVVKITTFSKPKTVMPILKNDYSSNGQIIMTEIKNLFPF